MSRDSGVPGCPVCYQPNSTTPCKPVGNWRASREVKG
jgi:hypothetical protein